MTVEAELLLAFLRSVLLAFFFLFLISTAAAIAPAAMDCAVLRVEARELGLEPLTDDEGVDRPDADANP